MITEHDLLTTAEVAEVLRAPESTIRYWRHTGAGPACFRLGRRVLYRRGEVQAWIQDAEAADPSHARSRSAS